MPAQRSRTKPGSPLALDGGLLSVLEVEDVARAARPVALGDKALKRIATSEAALARALAGGGPIYGVNTGFGSLSRQRIPDADLAEVQRNLLRSHAAGIGESLDAPTVRAMLLLLAASLSRGHSGVRPQVVQAIVEVLNAGIIPVVPSVGSVGASGDLAPLAHACLVLIGEGEALVKGKRTAGGEALHSAGITPIQLGAKEGLALINGTHLMAAQACLAMADAVRVFDAAVCGLALSIDACRATDVFLDERVYAARNHDGPGRVAARLRNLLAGSEIIVSHRENDPRVQDPYSLRCGPVVLGAALDTIEHVKRMLERELGAVTDNPLIFPPQAPGDRIVVSAGNFHGMPIALPLDLLTPALTHIAGVAERRIYHLLGATDPQNPVHAHLSPQPGLHSGLMITQYTAAACVNELVTLCTPATVSNVPTCAGMEDYNSFGPRAAAKARRAVELCIAVVAIELLCSSEALEYHRPMKSGDGVERIHRTVRERVPRLTADRPPSPDIEAISAMIREGRFGN